MPIRIFFINLLLLMSLPVIADGVIKIENNSFGVVRENHDNNNGGLILFVNNNNCVSMYRVAMKELILGEGEMDVKGFKKYIQFGNEVLEIACETQNALSIRKK